jgi:hypothetical protein
MTERDFDRLNDTQAAPTEDQGAPGYSRPRLAHIGSVVRTVQSGPTGNRNETYQGSYWSDR